MQSLPVRLQASGFRDGLILHTCESEVAGEKFPPPTFSVLNLINTPSRHTHTHTHAGVLHMYTSKCSCESLMSVAGGSPLVTGSVILWTFKSMDRDRDYDINFFFFLFKNSWPE